MGRVGYGTGDKDTCCQAWLPERFFVCFYFVLFPDSLMHLRLALNFHVVELLLFSLATPLKCWDYGHVDMVYVVLWIESRALCLVGKLCTTEVFF